MRRANWRRASQLATGEWASEGTSFGRIRRGCGNRERARRRDGRRACQRASIGQQRPPSGHGIDRPAGSWQPDTGRKNPEKYFLGVVAI